MKGSLTIKIITIAAFFCILSSSVKGQILKDSAALSMLKRCVDSIYDFRFEKARELSGTIKNLYPEHPVNYMLNAMITYWEQYPLNPSSPGSDSYESDLRKCIAICEEEHDQSDYPEYLLANLGARGLLLMHYADNDLSDKVFPLARSTYQYLRQAFNYTSFYYDFYFFTGLYNYYREAYPDAHPVYKMLAFLFPKGDIKKGLGEMEIASTKSIMLKAESYFFLSHIYLSYENDYKKAESYSKALNELYPGNPEYLSIYIRNLLLEKKYTHAELLVPLLKSDVNNVYFRAKVSIFSGLLQEKVYKNYTLAEDYYNQGLLELDTYGYFGNEYEAYAYFGLSRLADMKGDKHSRKEYRKRATDLTNYKKINFDD